MNKSILWGIKFGVATGATLVAILVFMFGLAGALTGEFQEALMKALEIGLKVSPIPIIGSVFLGYIARNDKR